MNNINTRIRSIVPLILLILVGCGGSGDSTRSNDSISKIKDRDQLRRTAIVNGVLTPLIAYYSDNYGNTNEDKQKLETSLEWLLESIDIQSLGVSQENYQLQPDGNVRHTYITSVNYAVPDPEKLQNSSQDLLSGLINIGLDRIETSAGTHTGGIRVSDFWENENGQWKIISTGVPID
jgi:hypothetical protein